jgi:hypothetical protein
MKNRTLLIPLFLMILTFSSCIGISADIQIRKDGSGRLALEYRYSRMAENIGRLDGNERWNIVPAGKADMERTIARIPDMKLVSFSSKETSKDIVNKAVLDFKNTDALLKFLDSSKKRAVLTKENGKNKLSLILNEPIPKEIDGDLMDLMKQTAAGYRASVSFSADKASTMTVTDGKGNEITAPNSAKAVLTGKKVSLAIDTSDMLELTDGLGIIITW